MIYKFRVILDAQEDIFRDLEIQADNTLEDFHNAINQAFGFDGGEMASFYISDDQWNQGEEIPLFDMGDNGANTPLMHTTSLESILNEDNRNLIYIYDFLNMWTFFVELADIAEAESGKSYPNLMFAFGNLPEVPPEKTFESDNTGDIDLDMEEPGIENTQDYDDLDFEENWN